MFSERMILEVDRVLRTLMEPARSERPHPDAGVPDAELSASELQHAAGLMRVNHCGEVCAQALYQGQALTACDSSLREAVQQAAEEEVEHLAWTERRIVALGGRKSLLNPLWYAGSLTLGLVAGRFGDRWSLGFLAETELQVEAHLQGHLSQLPANDLRSRRVVEQMKSDEAAHAQTARQLGGADLPPPVRQAMKLMAGVMTRLSYRL